MQDVIDRLKNEIAETKTATAGIKAVLRANTKALRDLVASNAGAAEMRQTLTQMADELDAEQADIAAAVVENTLASDEDEDEPVPGEGGGEGDETDQV